MYIITGVSVRVSLRDCGGRGVRNEGIRADLCSLPVDNAIVHVHVGGVCEG